MASVKRKLEFRSDFNKYEIIAYKLESKFLNKKLMKMQMIRRLNADMQDMRDSLIKWCNKKNSVASQKFVLGEFSKIDRVLRLFGQIN